MVPLTHKPFPVSACNNSETWEISSHLGLSNWDNVDPDTRDYCRARAKLPEAALHELTTTVAKGAERLLVEFFSLSWFGPGLAKTACMRNTSARWCSSFSWLKSKTRNLKAEHNRRIT